MKLRLIAAFSLLPILLAVLFFLPSWATTVTVAMASVVAVWELLHTTKLVRHKRLIAYSMVMAVAIAVWSHTDARLSWGIAGLWVYCVALIGEMLAGHAKLGFDKITITASAGIVIPLCYTAFTRMTVTPQGDFYVFIALILAFIADSGAYFAGRFFGKHKLAPIISPKKTVEGAIGGVISVMLVMCLYGWALESWYHVEYNYLVGLIYGFVGAIASIVGDLTFSVIKRQVGIKDYGKIIPGHGGILDRCDSMVLVAPLTEILMYMLPIIR